MICFRKERTGYRYGLALLVVIGLVLCAPARAASNAGLHPTGYKPPTPEEEARAAPYTTKVKSIDDLPSFRSLQAKGLVSATETNLPSKVANLQYLPVVGLQLWNDCGSFSPSYYVATYEFAKARGWIRPDLAVNPERVMSPGFAFQIVGSGLNDGASLGAVLELICQYGIATWKELPESAYYRYYPNTEAIWRIASSNRGDRILQFELSTDAGIQAVKAYLASGHILSTGSSWLYSDVQDAYPTGTNTDNGVMYGGGVVFREPRSGHAYALIGYDDNKTYNAGGIIKQGAFLFVNSWGPGWGVTCEPGGTAGYCWFGYDYARTYIGDVSGLTVRENYQPKDYLVIDVEHPKFGEMGLSVQAGPFSVNHTNTEVVLPLPSFGARRFSGRIAKDITDLAGPDPMAYWLNSYDAYLPAFSGPGIYEGSITNAWIEKNGGQILPASGMPLKTMDWSSVAAPVGYIHSQNLVDPGLDLDWKQRPVDFCEVWADVDKDGDPDLLLNYRAEGVRQRILFRNDSGILKQMDSGLPEDNLPFWGQGPTMAAGDYDGDGYVDLALLTGDKGLRIFRNNMGRGFYDSGIDMPSIAIPSPLLWADCNGDGVVDLTVGGHVLVNQRTNFVDRGAIFADRSQGAWGDYNNDGLLDYVCGGTVWRQMPGGSFNAVASVPDGSCAWGDYNGDGLLDLAVCSWGRTFICRNDGEAHTPAYQQWAPAGGYETVPEKFELRLALLPGTPPGGANGGVQWVDVDNDGRMDIVGGGEQGGNPIYDTGRAVVLRQRSPGVFEDIGGLERLSKYYTGLQKITFYWGDIGVVDVDGDGDVDMSLVGETPNLGSSMPDIHPSACCLFRSVVADPQYINRPNAPPATPGGGIVTAVAGRAVLAWSAVQDDHTPQASISYRVRVGTQPGACDVVSPAQGQGKGAITHSWRIGSSYPFHGPTNWGITPPGPPPAEVVAQTNAPFGLRLSNLPQGRYYWSVQAVDGSRAASPWSVEQSFSWGATAVRTGDLNGDGVVDAADLVLCRRMVSSKTTPNLVTADMDANGLLDNSDVRLLAKLILGQTSGTNFLPLAQAKIGPAGGRLAAADFEVIVPSGAFLSDATLTLDYSCEQPPPGAPRQSPLFQVTGIPGILATSLVVRVPDGRQSTTNPIQVALGQWLTSSKDRETPRLSYQRLGGEKDADGWLRFNVWPDQSAKIVPSKLGPASVGTLDIGGATNFSPVSIMIGRCDGWKWSGMQADHFRVWWTGDKPRYALDLLSDLEDAYALYVFYYPQISTLRNMNVNGVVKGAPLDVYMMALDGAEGEVFGQDPDSEYMGIDTSLVTVENMDEKRRTTAFHEFFHVVQDIVCMRPYDRRINGNGDTVKWFPTSDNKYLEAQESASTWVERFATTRPNYYPDLWGDFEIRNLVFDGYSYSRQCATNTSFWSWSGDRINKTGYAFSSLLIYFEQRFGTKYVFDIFNRIAAGMDREDAVIGSLPIADMSWHNDFYKALVLNDPNTNIWGGYPVYMTNGKRPPQWPDRTVDLSEAGNQPAANIRMYLAGLGAQGTLLTYPFNLVATAQYGGVVFALHNEKYQDEDLSVFRTHDRVESNADTLGGTNYTTSPGVKRYFLPGITNAFGCGPNSIGHGSFQHSLIALAVRSNPEKRLRDQLYTEFLGSWLNVGLANMGGSSNVVSAATIQGWPLGDYGSIVASPCNPYFPVFDCRSTVSFSNLVWTLTGREDVIPFGTYTTRWNEVNLEIWSDGRIECPAVAVFSPISTAATYTDSSYDSHQVTYSPRTANPFVVDKYSAFPDNTFLIYDYIPHAWLISRTPITGSNFVMRLEAQEDEAYFQVIRFYSTTDTNQRTGAGSTRMNYITAGLFRIRRF